MILASLALLAVFAQEPATPPESAPAEDAAPAASSGSAREHVDAGLKSYRRRRMKEAENHFRAAVAADPQSAEAAYYLGYTLYKIGEPSHRMNAAKKESVEWFAKAFSLDPAFKPVWGPKPKA